MTPWTAELMVISFAIGIILGIAVGHHTKD